MTRNELSTMRNKIIDTFQKAQETDSRARDVARHAAEALTAAKDTMEAFNKMYTNEFYMSLPPE